MAVKQTILISIIILFFLSPCWANLPTFNETQEFSQWLNDIKYWTDIKDFLYTCELTNQIEETQNPDQFFYSKVGNVTDFSWFISYAWIRSLKAYKSYIATTPEYTYAVIETNPNKYLAIKCVNILDITLIYTLAADNILSIAQLEEVTTTVELPKPKKKKSSSSKNYCTIDGVCY